MSRLTTFSRSESSQFNFGHEFIVRDEKRVGLHEEKGERAMFRISVSEGKLDAHRLQAGVLLNVPGF